MTIFGDQRTQAVALRDAVRNVPEDVTAKAARKLDILQAACSLDDARLAGYGRVLKERASKPPRFYVHVDGRWWIGFLWAHDRAFDIRLEER